MKTSYGAVLRVLLPCLLLLQDARILLAYNAGLLQPLQGNPRMSAAGGNGAQNSAAEPMTTRLQAIRRVAAVSLVPATVPVLGSLVAFPGDARAEKGAAAETKGAKQWISGKGAQPKGSEDKTGTRKESKYLRCLSNCLAECQKPSYGPERDREECLQVCQDECCTSYEQCTYAVTQNK